MTERTITVEDLPAEFERLAAMAISPSHTNIWNSAADMLRAALSSDHQGGRGELEKFRERKDDCGVCGVPGTNRREVCEGYSVPRCDDHRDLPAYQAESRLDTLLSDQPPAPRGLNCDKFDRPPVDEWPFEDEPPDPL